MPTLIDPLRRLLADRTLLPPGTPWAMCIYSQGAIIGSTVWLQDIAPPTGSLHWRLKDWRATIAFGNPYREVDIERDPAAAEFVMSVNRGNQTVPTVKFADGSALTNPSLNEVKAKLGR